MRKLAIVGSHTDTAKDAPFSDPAYEIWVFNEAPQSCPGYSPEKPQYEWCTRWDVCFQMHKPEVYMSPNNMVHPDHWQWLQKNHGRKTIYMQDYDEFVPNSRRYPLDELCTEFPPAKLRWLTSTPSYALALALYQGYEYIEIWGVELTSNTEYSYQLENWLYWVGVAKGILGDNLVLNSGQVHFKSRLYAYEGEIQIDRAFFRQRKDTIDADFTFAETAMKRAWERLDKAIIDGKFTDIPDLCIKMQDASLMCGELAGAQSEAENYAARYDPITRQEFERRAATAQNGAEIHRVQMYHEGGKVEYVFNVWKDKQVLLARDQMRLFVQKQIKEAYDTGANLGIYRENQNYMMEYDARLTAAGGERTRKALTGEAA